MILITFWRNLMLLQEIKTMMYQNFMDLLKKITLNWTISMNKLELSKINHLIIKLV